MQTGYFAKSNQNTAVKFLILLTVFSISCASARKATHYNEKLDLLVETARKFSGTPYKYGGTTRAGMDCSGLLINTFYAVNIELPHNSEAQSKLGKEVSLSEVQPGDLVFFATGKKKNKISHVGMVTSVKSKDDIRFIHASTTLGVVETNIFSDYYKPRFITARRILIEP